MLPENIRFTKLEITPLLTKSDQRLD